MRTSPQVARSLRLAVLLIALAALVGVSASTTAHFHAGPSNGCEMCFVAHALSLDHARVAAQPLPLPVVQGPVECGMATPAYRLSQSKASLTRGPPSLAL